MAREGRDSHVTMLKPAVFSPWIKFAQLKKRNLTSLLEKEES
jgi:hypothetical protein